MDLREGAAGADIDNTIPLSAVLDLLWSERASEIIPYLTRLSSPDLVCIDMWKIKPARYLRVLENIFLTTKTVPWLGPIIEKAMVVIDKPRPSYKDIRSALATNILVGRDLRFLTPFRRQDSGPHPGLYRWCVVENNRVMFSEFAHPGRMDLASVLLFGGNSPLRSREVDEDSAWIAGDARDEDFAAIIPKANLGRGGVPHLINPLFAGLLAEAELGLLDPSSPPGAGNPRLYDALDLPKTHVIGEWGGLLLLIYLVYREQLGGPDLIERWFGTAIASYASAANQRTLAGGCFSGEYGRLLYYFRDTGMPKTPHELFARAMKKCDTKYSLNPLTRRFFFMPTYAFPFEVRHAHIPTLLPSWRGDEARIKSVVATISRCDRVYLPDGRQIALS